jgi:putative membrane protein
MDILAWAGRIAFFLVVLWLALQNNATVPLRLTSTLQWQGVPLVAVILACFLAGVLAGTLALVPMMLRLRRATAKREARRRRDFEASTVEIALTRAARQGGAVGDLDVDTRIPR